MMYVVAACGLWLALLALVLRRGGLRSRLGLGALTVTGVPLLGLVTYLQGPLIGLLALGCAAAVLCLHHLPRLYASGALPHKGE